MKQGQIGDSPVNKVLREISKELDKVIRIAGNKVPVVDPLNEP